MHPAAVCFFPGYGARAARVRSGLGLGQRPAAELFPLRERDYVFLFLLFGAELVNVIRAERIVRRDDDADRPVHTREFLDDDVSPCRLCVTWPSAAEPGCDPPAHEERLLAIRYCEEAVDPQYAMLSDCTCQGGKEASRIREQVAWKLAGRDELLHCWPDERPLVHDDCDERSGGHSGCIEPYCRCDGWVPLAVLTRREGAPIHISELLAGRLPAAGYLTKISRINWPHGGELELDELIERRGRLEVDFDRPLLEADGDARGINQFTFRVQYGGLERNLGLPALAGGQSRSGGPDQGRLHDRTRALGPGESSAEAAGDLAVQPPGLVHHRHLAV